MSEKKQLEDQSTSKICDFPTDSDSEELKYLADDPEYLCVKCERSAASSENLCRPVRNFSAW